MELLQRIEAHYGLGPVELRQPLAGGYANEVSLLDAGGKPFVLRVKHPPVVPESLAWEHDLLARLDLDIVPAPVPARDGSTFYLHDGLAVSVLPYVADRPAAPADGTAVAVALGRFHAAAASLEVSQRPTVPPLAEIDWPPPRLPPRLAGRLPALEDARRWAIERTRSIAAPVQTIHGDFFPGNVLVDRGRVTALLDWEEARVDWPGIDLAAGVWHFAPFDRKAADRFVTVYRNAGGADVDPALLDPLIRIKRILEVLRAPTDRYVDWEYQLDNLRAIERLAEA